MGGRDKGRIKERFQIRCLGNSKPWTWTKACPRVLLLPCRKRRDYKHPAEVLLPNKGWPVRPGQLPAAGGADRPLLFRGPQVLPKKEIKKAQKPDGNGVKCENPSWKFIEEKSN